MTITLWILTYLSVPAVFWPASKKITDKVVVRRFLLQHPDASLRDSGDLEYELGRSWWGTFWYCPAEEIPAPILFGVLLWPLALFGASLMGVQHVGEHLCKWIGAKVSNIETFSPSKQEEQALRNHQMERERKEVSDRAISQVRMDGATDSATDKSVSVVAR